jgi:hypothetical protein
MDVYSLFLVLEGAGCVEVAQCSAVRGRLGDRRVVLRGNATRPHRLFSTLYSLSPENNFLRPVISSTLPSSLTTDR